MPATTENTVKRDKVQIILVDDIWLIPLLQAYIIKEKSPFLFSFWLQEKLTMTEEDVM